MDKVILVDDERLDIVDVNRLQDFVDEGLANGAGGIISIGAGTFTQLGHGGADIANVTIGPGQLYDAQTLDDGNRVVGRVLKHDPSIPEQAALSTINFTPYIGQKPWIWARRRLEPTDFETRRKWVILATAEQTFNLDTIRRELIEWHLGFDPPVGDEEGWFKVGFCSTIAPGIVFAGNPLIIWIHPFDATDGFDAYGDPFGEVGPIAQLWELSDAIYLSGGGVLGIGKTLKQIMLAVMRLRDENTGDSGFVYDPPAIGAFQTKARLDAIDADKAVVDEAGLRLILGGVLIPAGSIYNDDLLYSYPDPDAAITTQKLSDGRIRITCPGEVYFGHGTSVPLDEENPSGAKYVVTVGNVDYDAVADYSTFDVRIWNAVNNSFVDNQFYLSAYGKPFVGP